MGRLEDFIPALQDFRAAGSEHFSIEAEVGRKRRAKLDVDLVSNDTTRRIIMPDRDVDLQWVPEGPTPPGSDVVYASWVNTVELPDNATTDIWTAAGIEIPVDIPAFSALRVTIDWELQIPEMTPINLEHVLQALGGVGPDSNVISFAAVGVTGPSPLSGTVRASLTYLFRVEGGTLRWNGSCIYSVAGETYLTVIDAEFAPGKVPATIRFRPRIFQATGNAKTAYPSYLRAEKVVLS